jgi:aldose 1-epimerase
MIALTRGDLRLELSPDIGGAVTRLAWRDIDLLRPTPLDANHAIQTSSFPLVPYANRIAHGKFNFAGRNVHLSRNWDGDAHHPLHGQGWINPWGVSALTSDSATLRFEHANTEWPWAYAAEQEITLLDERRVRIDLSVQNRDTRPMPAGLGFHPAFPAPVDTRLQAHVEGVWLVDDTFLPTRHIPSPGIVDWSANPLLADAQGMDHCHTGFKGPAVITWPHAHLQLSVTAPEWMHWLQIYVPRDKDYFCLEPVSHMPDPFHQSRPGPTGIVSVEPGKTFAGWMEIAVAPLAGKRS